MTHSEPIVRFASSRFGDLEVPENKLITIPEGIIGFPDFKRYALLDPSGGESIFLWLHAIDEPKLAFIIADPLSLIPNYQIDSSEPDLERLEISQKEPPAIYVIITVPPDDPDHINANLLAPLLYFKAENILFQIVLEKTDWPLRYYFLETKESESDDQTVDRESSGEVL